MSEVPLLNPASSDGRVAQEIIDLLRQRVQDVERRLTAQKVPSYEDYVGLYETLQALQKAVSEAEAIFGKHFKI